MEYPPPASKMLKKQKSPIKTGVFLLAIILLALIPSTAIPVAALDECEKLLATSQEECEAAGCNWCSKEDGINCDQICPCRKDCSAKKGYEDSCSYDTECADGLECTGTEAGKTAFLFAQACCYPGEVWDPETKSCNKEAGVGEIASLLSQISEPGSLTPFQDSENGAYYGHYCDIGVCVDGDSNCDGTSDSGCPTSKCSASKEICNYKDDDCDGVADDGCLSFCSKCGKGLFNLCEKEECDQLGPGCVFNDGIWNTCKESIKPPETKKVIEVCNKIDDDMDGIIDEDCQETMDMDMILKSISLMSNQGKECESSNECGGLICKGSKVKICCFDYEDAKSGKCVDTRKNELESCSEDSQCKTFHCSTPITSFVGQIIKAVVSNPANGKCCDQGTEYNKATGTCEQSGTFSEQNSSRHCEEKKAKGIACEDGEGNCRYDNECLGGSYCDRRIGVNVCCPKGAFYSGEKCEYSETEDCSLCGKGWLNRCDSQECSSLGQKCVYDTESNKCSKRDVILRHDYGNCNTPETRCEGNNRCSVYKEYGVCCYEWEEQNPATKRCSIACNDKFCDFDKDLYNSEVELRFGANPLVKKDTPWIRMGVEICSTPFDYRNYDTAMPAFFNNVITTVSGGLGNGLIGMFDGIVSFAADLAFFRINPEKAGPELLIPYGKVTGILTGAVYGGADDIGFVADIAKFVVKSPKMIKNLAEKWSHPPGNVTINEDLISQYANERIDESTRNSFMEAASTEAYKVDLFALGFCNKQILTKTFSSAFMGGYILEQVYLLEGIGKAVLKLSARVTNGLAEIALRLAGKTFLLVDNPIGYGVINPISKLMNDPVRMINKKFGESIFRSMDEKQLANSAELVFIISKSNEFWKHLIKEDFLAMLNNFMKFKDMMAKAYGTPEEGIKLANTLMGAKVGQNVFLYAYGKQGWDNVWLKSLADAVEEYGQKDIDHAFVSFDSKTIASFGEQLSKANPKKSIAERLFEPSSLQRALSRIKSGQTLKDYLENLEYGTVWVLFNKEQNRAILKNYQDVADILIKKNIPRAAESLSILIDTHIGARVLLLGIDEGNGWGFNAIKLLAEEMNSKGVKGISEALNQLDETELRRFGKDLSEVISEEGEESAGRYLTKGFVEIASEAPENTAKKIISALDEMDGTMLKKGYKPFTFSEKKALAESIEVFHPAIRTKIFAELKNSNPQFVKEAIAYFDGSRIRYLDHLLLERFSGKNSKVISELAKKGTSYSDSGNFIGVMGTRITFRGEGRLPSEEIFSRGMISNGLNDNLAASMVTTSESAWIHASKSIDTAYSYGRNVYVIISKEGTDANKALKPSQNFVPAEEIVAYYRAIPSQNIGGYSRFVEGKPTKWTENPSAEKAVNEYNQEVDDLVYNANEKHSKKFAESARKPLSEAAEGEGSAIAKTGPDTLDEELRYMTGIDRLPAGETGKILSGNIKDYPFFDSIKENLKTYGARVEYDPLLHEPSPITGKITMASYHTGTKILTYGPNTQVGHLLHELRHFAQHRSRDFEEKLGGWHKDLLKNRFGYTEEKIAEINRKATPKQMARFIKEIEEFDAYSYSIGNAEIFGLTKPEIETLQREMIDNQEGIIDILRPSGIDSLGR